MATRRRRRKTLLVKTTELAFAAPQVVAHRMARMARAGNSPSKSDRREFQQMGLEKAVAFGASWQAMALQLALANQRLMMDSLFSLWTPMRSRRPSQQMMQLQRAALGVLEKGLSPIHRKATSNAKRLGRIKRTR